MRLISAIILFTYAVAFNLDARQIQSIKAFQALEPYQVISPEPRQWSNALSFGIWHTTSPQQHHTQGSALAILGLPLDAQTPAYQLTMTNGLQWQYLECVSRRHLTEIAHWPVHSNKGQKPALACGISGLADVTFYLTPEWDNQFVGYSELSDRSIKIRSLHFLEKTTYPTLFPVGYLLTDEQGALAQVEISGSGRVWFRPGLTDQTQLELAARVAVLLLFNPQN
ncbi:hypothetical protein Rhein_3920 [Rheinheimera sp. A13L]|uniref:hypothetical protein n=1 Tax=Rheinheimera sp. A13L TaxID=506534 RepID=UPI0002124E01|nr:hypothetical protein [Rheinheimera sp. A13L]EGM75928.1 hypothetical protein Rhein_3920 [Rheinheimera sp. A13L]